MRKRLWGSGPASRRCPGGRAPDERWATDLCRSLDGPRWMGTARLVIDRYSRAAGLAFEPQRQSQRRRVSAGASADRPQWLPGQGQAVLLLRSDNGLVFTSRSYTALVKSHGLQQEFITPYSPEQNGMIERVIRTLKDQCVHHHRFETLQHANRVIADWITTDDPSYQALA